MNKLSVIGYRLSVIGMLATLLLACSSEAKWETQDVTINMSVHNISAGFIECNFSTNKEAYYLIACEPAREGEDPLEFQKQFMMLALDSANVEYLAWRNGLLKQGEFNIAPFASHALQYGDVHYFFTGLTADTDYWIYAFVVNPETMKPVGKLYLQKVRTALRSTMTIFFEYRVKGYWDYTYPKDASGNICDYYPYVAATRDSLEIAEEGVTPQTYFSEWYAVQLAYSQWTSILYGVKAVLNDGYDSYLEFEEGHTYYTYLSGFDGSQNPHVIYKFTWQGESTNLYFTERDKEPEE